MSLGCPHKTGCPYCGNHNDLEKTIQDPSGKQQWIMGFCLKCGNSYQIPIGKIDIN